MRDVEFRATQEEIDRAATHGFVPGTVVRWRDEPGSKWRTIQNARAWIRANAGDVGVEIYTVQGAHGHMQATIEHFELRDDRAGGGE